MRISSRTRYAAIAVLHLSKEYRSGKPVTISRISGDHGISLKFLENIMRSLVTAGLVNSIKGKKGGYILARPPADTSVYDVFLATEGRPEADFNFGDAENSQKLDSRSVRDVWWFLGETISEYLKSISFQGMIEKQNKVYSTLKRLKEELLVF